MLASELPWLEAIALAARAHQGQLRKDRRTPYVSHVFRVCLIVRDVFGCADPAVLTTAVLHDTIEDTTTDYDDIAEGFGPEIAGWVAALTKNKSLPHDVREAAYAEVLAQAPWQVQVCKLADVFDNLTDSRGLSPEGRQRSLDNARRYLAALRSGLKPEAAAAWQLVAARLEQAASEGDKVTR
jgi:guanosine-3',5'-bis(diphosphate) 3'-pyrophosphohydrolase